MLYFVSDALLTHAARSIRFKKNDGTMNFVNQSSVTTSEM